MNVSPAEAQRLVASGAPVLDVRTAEEFALEGHIEGARLVPAQELAGRLDEVPAPKDGAPLIVVCEHGVRSRWAAALLTERGFAPVVNLTGGMSVWPYARLRGVADADEEQRGMPSSWLVRNLQHLRLGSGLDVACGYGRNALLLARMGWTMTAVDRDPEALAGLSAAALAHRVRIAVVARDLETGDAKEALPAGPWDLIVVTRYLHRPLLPAMREAVRPGGVIVYETFTTAQAQFGSPSNPDFLLAPGELPRAFEGFEIIAAREEIAAGRRAVAGVVARRPRGAVPEYRG